MATVDFNREIIPCAGGADVAPHARDRRVPVGVWLAGALVAALSCATIAFAVFRPVQVLPLLRPAPPLSLHDPDGVPISSAALHGAVVVLQFSALSCPAPCGDGHQTLQELQRRLAAAPFPLRVHLVSVVLDGEQRPQALGARRAALGADARLWQLATADAAQLEAIVGGGFAVYAVRDGEGRVTFDPATILVDERGLIRAEYRTAAPDAALIWRDIGLITREASSRGAARSLYSAAHLFLCYPR